MEHGFIAGADTDAKLFEQRLEYLQSRSGQGVKLPADLTSAGNIVTNAVGLAAVQLIDVSMTHHLGHSRTHSRSEVTYDKESRFGRFEPFLQQKALFSETHMAGGWLLKDCIVSP